LDQERRQQVKADLALLFVAFIWGATFVVVDDALSGIGPFYFLALRFFIAFLFLALVCRRQFRYANWETMKAGVLIGLFLFGGYGFQTVGLKYTGPATAAFITGFAVVLVPVFSSFLAKKLPGLFVTVGVISATAGLALLTLRGGISNLNYGDLLVFFCAICFSGHIVAVGRYAREHNPVVLAMTQIATVSLLSLIIALGTESFPAWFTRPVWVGLIICSIPATSVAFLIQNSVQRYSTPSHTAIIFTMEPVFGLLMAYLLAREMLSVQQVLGSLLILAGMLVAEFQTPPRETRGFSSSHPVR